MTQQIGRDGRVLESGDLIRVTLVWPYRGHTTSRSPHSARPYPLPLLKAPARLHHPRRLIEINQMAQ